MYLSARTGSIRAALDGLAYHESRGVEEHRELVGMSMAVADFVAAGGTPEEADVMRNLGGAYIVSGMVN
jgi:hypothetical protein